MEEADGMLGKNQEEIGRLLLVDDDETFLRSTAELLRREGYECDVAIDAAAASDLLRTRNYHALVTDVRMPGNTALEFLAASREKFVELPVIVVTGYPSVSTAVTSLRLAAVDYLLKPIDFTELKQSVERAVARGRKTESAKRFFSELREWLNESPARLPLESLPASAASAAGFPPSDPLGNRLDGLSPREREIVGAVLSGKRVSAVARTLDISPHTVRNHLKSIFRKLGVHSQVELLGRLR
jgi:DNA-binding NarL/FixJ family response regulator